MAQSSNENALHYQDQSDSEDSTSSREPTTAVGNQDDDDKAEYDDDDDDGSDDKEPGQESGFQALLNDNIFLLDETDDTVLIGLKERQHIFISGVFQLQIVKGGVLYGHTHFNASRDSFTAWHPLCDAVTSIQSSYYAGWEEGVHIQDRHKEIVECDLKDFSCIIKIKNAPVERLLDISNLYPEVKYLWKVPQNLNRTFTSERCGYHILDENLDTFIPLRISKEWLTILETLGLDHKNSSYDMRVMILGGKNSGKSTLLRLLTQNFLYGGSSQEEILYLDLDPGQPEFSPPDCISLNQVNKSSRVLGKHMGQCFHQVAKEHYLGSNSPQEIPNLYLHSLTELIDYLDEQTFMGTSVVNLPGWIKGFGLNILNHVIKRYKPTHIVMLESKSSKQYFDELNVDALFQSTMRDEYYAQVIKAHANFHNFDESRFSAPTLRIFKMLSHFHTQVKSKTSLRYDFNPLVTTPPFQISFGSRGIQGIHFFEEFEDLNKDDIKNSLEGTVIGLYYCLSELEDFITFSGSFPIIKSFPKRNEFCTLALIHSIDLNNKVINMYIPEFQVARLDKNPELKWIIARGKSETPVCELFPSNNFFSNRQVPYISVERRKKYEYIWKVRKNVMRRGFHKN